MPHFRIETVRDDATLQQWVDVVDAVDVWGVPSFEDARYLRETQVGRVDYVLRRDGVPVGAAFVRPPAGGSGGTCAVAGLWVRREHRCQGLGSELHRTLSAHARGFGMTELEVEAYESQEDALRYLGRRGYREVARHTELVLELEGLPLPQVRPPEGVRIVPRTGRDDLLPGMYRVALEAIPDMPVDAADDVGTFEDWRASDIDRPIHTPDLTFVALHGDEVVGYAVLQRGRNGVAFHSLTGVKRAWRGRGIASALKRAQIGGAIQAGFKRLVTENVLENAPIRHLNEVMGYRPLPGAVVFRGPM
ncbi:GNAT family N-acetyltransferase [Myxococcus sp. RHSTA-1-4]|uniref:GNAT family N-acetyltransferase n=1 Tax=Myxococcus sp. RHSTA-1-4 TaxID=2874601 RepID=UPI001CBBCBDE|nr:GNAT family N-acetyltransferase [Myxococcus sp. RHSTA-1-4]MBZ4418509.1 GNAT family N-acetyltransferase [Myxococcus sp. RHSTA-1-4]